MSIGISVNLRPKLVPGSCLTIRHRSRWRPRIIVGGDWSDLLCPPTIPGRKRAARLGKKPDRKRVLGDCLHQWSIGTSESFPQTLIFKRFAGDCSVFYTS